MKCKMVVTLAALLLSASMVAWAAPDGQALYKSKCASCHGAEGGGKPSMKVPALKGSTIDVDKLTEHIRNGDPAMKPPHNKGIAGISEDQAKAIAEYVRTLK
jgi:mono/diheme cytochrome c family protein